jgi:RNA polymerase sigma-70 factor (ECF subfamily)
LARRLAASADEARDLVQEAFLRAARRPSSVPSGATSEEAWLVRVMVNIARDGWRRRAVQRDFRARHAPVELPVTAPSDEAAIVARQAVWAALGQLSPRRRAAIVLYELEGVGMPDIARLLGVSVVTVRWHLSRGRHELARILDGRATP